MPDLFDQTTLNGMPLRNRLVRSATWEGMCDDAGAPTEKLNACYQALARGGVGLIISGYTYVRVDGKQLPRKMGLDNDTLEPAMRGLTAAVHEAGGVLCVQLVHAGGQATAASAGRTPLAPSAVETAQFSEIPDEMSHEDIVRVIEAFGSAAGRAKAWGFDAVQLHAAHGYLINQFLSPHTNRRTDEFGGTAENRRRFLLDVYTAVRGAVGKDFPVLVKLNGADNVEGGLRIEDAVSAARALDQAGIDAIEVSGGTPASGKEGPVRTKIDARDKEAYNRDLARAVKQAVSCPVMCVGGIRSYETAEEILQAGDGDYISLARPLIREPDLPNRWQGEDRSPAKCISCNGCFRPGLKGEGIYCVTEKKEREEKNRKEP